MKNNLRRCFMLLGCIAIALSITPVASAGKPQYVSIQDIREEVMGGWHETYEAHGRTIVVDVEICVPEVEEIPIVRVWYPGTITPLPANSDVGSSDHEGIAFVVKSEPDMFMGYGEPVNDFEPDAQAEESPLTAQEAQEFMLALVKQYEPQTGPLDLELRYTIASSREYANIKRNGEKVGIDTSTPVSPMGKYGIGFWQRLHGVPLFGGLGIYGDIASTDNYLLGLFPMIETGIVEQDVPLAPFSAAKKQWERMIKAGLIREIYEIRLCYLRFDDPDDRGQSFLLVPIWLLRGQIQDKASFPNWDLTEEQRAELKVLGGNYDYLDGQSAKTLFPKGAVRQRYYFPKIVTWQQVK